MDPPARHDSDPSVRLDTWRRLLASTNAVTDGREFLVAVLLKLKSTERGADAPPPLTDEQLRWVLDQIADESSY